MDDRRETKVVRIDAKPDATVRIHWVRSGRTFGESFVRREDTPDEADLATLQQAAMDASYQLHSVRQRCSCYGRMSGACPRCAEILAVEQRIDAALSRDHT